MSQSLASSAAKAARTGGLATAPGRAAAPAPRTSARRPPLRVVQAPRTSGSPLGFAMICAALLAAGLIGLLLLNTAVAQDSFGLQRLQAGSQQLTDQKQALIQSNDLAAAPAQLSAKAWALGLVPAQRRGVRAAAFGQGLGRGGPGSSGQATYRDHEHQPHHRHHRDGRPPTTAAPVVRTGPVLAPASPVARTAGTGTAPGLRPGCATGPGRPTGTETEDDRHDYRTNDTDEVSP